jgi:hypothetical protein
MKTLPRGKLVTEQTMWRFRGTPHYLEKQAVRLGISQSLAHRARHNPEIYHVSVLLAQLCERFHKARKENGRPVFFPTEMAEIRGTLMQAENELSKLHALAGSAQAMLDEAWRAFGFNCPERHFAVLCDYDAPSLPYGDGTVGVPDESTDAATTTISTSKVYR